MPSIRSLEGQRFGRLVVLGKHTEGKTVKWLCRCDCGEEKYIYRGSLLSGCSQSCGCLRRENSANLLKANRFAVTHGKSYTRTYHIWQGIKERCLNQHKKQYRRYGGRGIGVCDSWMDFENFLADMGECPDGLSIDRIDNNGNYEPKNCRWITMHEQFKTRTHTSTEAHKRACRLNQKKALEAMRKKRGK
jgi:hypothetical protein